MGWETRFGKKYFYLNRRLPGGRIQKQYFGRGLLAELESLRLETQAEIRRQIGAECQQTAAAESLLKQHVRSGSDLVHGLMAASGFTNEKHRGWRKIPVIALQEIDKQTATLPAESNQPPFAELVKAVRQGDRSVILALRKILWANPELAKCNGELGSRTQISWIDLIAGRDLYYRECLLLKIGGLKRELLADTSGSEVEKMLVDQAISTWLQLYYHEGREATAPAENVEVGQFRLKKIESAFNRHMRSLNALASIRAVNFSQRMNETMEGLMKPLDGAEKRVSASSLVTNADGNRIREMFDRSLEPVPLN